ncbi:phosphoribosyl-ATP diphosphatase [Gluconacetobacter tumulisoli]|uniref:Phosphoribosyl-ATP pyrophosphatase n=2 Tax=Gluconacetobacter tumulisoli TaxID=1286189 RepID=A0A7W4KA42_9PROT|nr:phosphoribosyl-ATP diphosphatase [Gluconacetobacter tumulisoli]MBB2203161.1 phosphoribosyl-ATP diphosphatase [Gluconacetobacter tumulisoli]
MPKPSKPKTAKTGTPKTARKAAPAPRKAAKEAETPRARKKAAALAAPVADAPPATSDVLDRLFAVVSSRKGTDPSISHSARLLSRGRRKIAQKFGEEAVECLIEAVAGNTGELVSESADVLYHLIVMWVDAGVQPADIWAELRRREGTSGIAEKAARPRDPLA